MRIKWYFLIIILMILSACASLGGFSSNFFGKKTPVGGKGVILTFEEAPENNEEVIEGYPLKMVIKIQNYVPTKQGLNGELCLRDDKTQNYGGIDENDCREISLPPATAIENKPPTPSEQLYYFDIAPYHDLAEEILSETVQTFADMKYEVESIATATTCIKKPAAQSSSIPANCGKKQDLQVQQTDLPIKISKLTTRAISAETESIVNMEVLLTKTLEGNVVSRQNIRQPATFDIALVDFEATINQMQATCGSVGNALEFRQNEKEKIIKCMTKIPLNEDFINAPIRIKMGYGFIQPIQGPTIKVVKGGIS